MQEKSLKGPFRLPGRLAFRKRRGCRRVDPPAPLIVGDFNYISRLLKSPSATFSLSQPARKPKMVFRFFYGTFCRKLFAKRSLRLFTVVAFFLLITIPLFAETSKSDWDYYQKQGHRGAKWDALVEAGFGAFESENEQAGLRFLKRAISLGCQDGLLFYKVALHQEKEGDFLGAIETFKGAESLLRKQYATHPTTKEVTDNIAGLYYQLNRFDEALKKYLEAIEQNGENFLRTYLAGQIYRMQGNVEQAVTYFEKALSYEIPLQAPGNMKLLAMMELLKLYADAKVDDKVLEISDKILALDPNNRTALSYRDMVQHQRRSIEQRKEWKEILKKYQ